MVFQLYWVKKTLIPCFWDEELRDGDGLVELLLCGMITLALKLLSQDRNAKLEIRIMAMMPSDRMYFLLRLIRQLIHLVKPFAGFVSGGTCKKTERGCRMEINFVQLPNFYIITTRFWL